MDLEGTTRAEREALRKAKRISSEKSKKLATLLRERRRKNAALIRSLREESKARAKGDRKGKRWSEREIQLLRWMWGKVQLSRIAKRLGRTKVTVRTRAYLIGLRNPNQGTYSLKGLSDHLGYDKGTVRRAIIALNLIKGGVVQTKSRISMKPGKKRRCFLISEEAAVIISQWLESHPNTIKYLPGKERLPPSLWGVCGRPPSCNRCKRTEFPHRAKGMCVPCYTGHRRRVARLQTAQPRPLAALIRPFWEGMATPLATSA